MRYSPIDNKLFIQNRKKYTKNLLPGALSIFNSNDIMPTNGDGTMPFKQNSDLFYLCGIDQEETILLLFPEAKKEEDREILFIKETNEHILTWEGYKLTLREATEISGIQRVEWLQSFEELLPALVEEAECIYLNANEHRRSDSPVETRDMRFAKWMKETFPEENYQRSAPVMHHLRMTKSPIEVDQMHHACGITEKAFRRILPFIRPGVYEFEVEAEITHEFTINRSGGHAYDPIIASGTDACVLHYTDNHKQCKDGDLVLMDFGAEYAHYCSDLTRTVPVNGQYTPRQKEVYNAVLRTLRHATSLLVAGTYPADYQKEVVKFIEQELIGLGLLTKAAIAAQDPEKPLFRKYFMHGTSHSIGLDTHDVDEPGRPFEAGMVYTCEPGIYIREEGIGVRIENDILITEEGNKDLMAGIPIEAEEIEELMNG